MKIRIKFKKYNVLRFIGHLDLMRYFQKLMRRASVPVAYSAGFSPHMIMSFAQPLGIGIISDAEYLDVNLQQEVDLQDLTSRLNEFNVDGLEIISITEIPEGKKYSGMANVAAADYACYVSTKALRLTWDQLSEKLQQFMDQEQILIQKKTKRSDAVVDIRPMIYSLKADSEGCIVMSLAQGSVENLKPSLVMEAILGYLGVDGSDVKVQIKRTELYAKVDDAYIGLDELK